MENNFAEMFRPLTDMLGKTKEEIVADFSQSARQLLFELSEMYFNSHALTSKGMLTLNMEEYNYDLEITGNICRSVYLYITKEELLKESMQYCIDNYPLVTDKVWLLASPENNGKPVVLFFFTKKTEKNTDVRYFQSVTPPRKETNLQIPP